MLALDVLEVADQVALDALPLREGDEAIVIEPLELPVVPLSCCDFQLLSACRALTLIAVEGTMLRPLVFVFVTTEPPTETITSATQLAPPVPQAFTCRV